MSDNGELYNTTRATRNNTTEAALTVSLKAGKGMGDPWVIVKADTVAQLQALLNDLHYSGIENTVAHVSRSLQQACGPESGR
jgi:hypothetical protein